MTSEPWKNLHRVLVIFGAAAFAAPAGSSEDFVHAFVTQTASAAVYRAWNAQAGSGFVGSQYSGANNALAACGGGTPLKGDVTGDGRQDLVQVYPDANGRPSYWIWAGQPSGGFAASPTHGYFDMSGTVARYGDTFLLGDINGDGLADLVNIYSWNGRIGYWAWLAQPGAGFATSPSHGYYDLGADRAGTALLGDINGDGRADLVQIYSYGGNTAYWAWLANSGAGFSTSISHGYLNLGSGHAGFYLLGDINADGAADLVQVYDYGGNIAYWAWLAQPGAGFSTSISHGYLNLGRPWGGGFLLADSDGDGIADLVQVSAAGATNEYSAWRANPGGGFSTTLSYWYGYMDDVRVGSFLGNKLGAGASVRHNFALNGDYAQWTGYSRPVTWANVANVVADGWFVGAGAFGTVTTSWMDFVPGQSDVPGNPSKYLRMQWSAIPPYGEQQHAPTHRATYVEHHNLGGVPDVNILSGQNVVVSFYARAVGGPLTVVPLLWHSYNPTPYDPALRGTTYELFESSGVPGTVALALGAPHPNASCQLTEEWQRCEKVITLPMTCGRDIWGGNYTGVGIDFIMTPEIEPGLTVELSNFQVERGARASAFTRF